MNRKRRNLQNLLSLGLERGSFNTALANNVVNTGSILNKSITLTQEKG